MNIVKEPHIIYRCNFCSLDIRAEGGPDKDKSVEFVLKNLLEVKGALDEISFMDDTDIPKGFIESSPLLLCPSNAIQEVKRKVEEKKGFVSDKRSTEAVVEFLTGYYPKYFRNNPPLHSLWFDMDGCIREERRHEDNVPFFPAIVEYTRSVTGFYTDRPPFSIATGAEIESLNRVLKLIKLWKENIPEQFHQGDSGFNWPPIVFENGALLYDPVTRNITDITGPEFGLVTEEYRLMNELVIEVGNEINDKLDQIDGALEAKSRRVSKKRDGFALDIPLEVQLTEEDLFRAHSIIYSYAFPILKGIMPPGIKVTFPTFGQRELEEASRLWKRGQL